MFWQESCPGGNLTPKRYLGALPVKLTANPDVMLSLGSDIITLGRPYTGFGAKLYNLKINLPWSFAPKPELVPQHDDITSR